MHISMIKIIIFGLEKLYSVIFETFQSVVWSLFNTCVYKLLEKHIGGG